MEVSSQINFLTDEELLSFFHRKKTEISCIQQPDIFLTQLKDHNLLPDTLFKKFIAMRTREQKQKGLYEVLEWLEKERSQHIRRFWCCVFEDHIIRKNPELRLLKKALLDSVINLPKELQDVEMLTKGREGEGKKKKQVEKTTISNDDSSSEDSDVPGPSSACTPTCKKPVRKNPSSSSVKKRDNPEIWTLSKYKTQLPIKCGDKEGTLYRDKLATGIKCILSQTQWFTPTEFEKFAGKERSKNWKVSIRCGNTVLKKLIEGNHLQCSPMKKRKKTYTRKSKEVRFEASSSDCSSQDSRPDMHEQFRNRVDEEEEEEEMSDLTAFQAPTLPVTCASLTGTLYKDRFASGRYGKSIRTEERWFTPEEFVMAEPTLTYGLWKRDILCHEKTLNFLIKKKILQSHSLLCECVKCSTDPDDLMDQRNDDVCYACRSGGTLVCCDECPRAFHSNCHLPAVPDDSSEAWECNFCVIRTSGDSRNMTEQEAFDAPVSQYLLQSQNLLLCMYKEDVERVFVEDPRQTVARYAEFISQPMWLNRIKQKLETNKYQKVGEFVSDFRLIFNNSSKFNWNNKFGQLGATMMEIFEKEMQKIFSIQ